MRAIVHDRYGSFDALELRELAKPEPSAGEVRVRVRAAGLHVGDCFGVRGAPFPMRFVSGLIKPKRGIPGFDFSGVIDRVGLGVTDVREGDPVFGECSGSCAEFVCAKPERLATKPEKLGFVEAAAVPTSALAALHAMRDVAKIEAGQRVLINGASGGVGSFAIQIAKHFGALVTGVCGPKNLDLVNSLGADEVIDYTKEDFTMRLAAYDTIFDNVENRALSACRRALKKDGTLIINSGTGAKGLPLLVRIVKPLLLSPFTRQKLRRYLSEPNREDLEWLAARIDADELRPVIDKVCTLDEVPAALAYIEAGHASGKVVVEL